MAFRALLALPALILLAGAGTASAASVNTGTAGSTCAAVRLSGTADPALDTTSLGELKAGYEIGAPAGPFGAAGVQRVMILVHGGSWYKVGRGAMASMRTAADGWRAAGWQTVNTDYRACRRSVHDVVALYDAVRARVGAGVPVCVTGASAGAHLALMLAALRSDVDCVLAEAGPTDLRRASATVTAYGRAAFGRDGLTTRSPVTYADRIRARVLLVATADDALVPYAQQTALADAIHRADATRYADAIELQAGAIPFVHGSASALALAALGLRAARLVAPFGAAPLSIVGPPFVFRRRAR